VACWTPLARRASPRSFGGMNRFTYIGWLAGQAADGLAYIWPVTLVLLVLLACAMFRDSSRARLRLSPRLLYLLCPAVGTLLILLAGSLFEEQPARVYLPYAGFGVAVLLAVIPAVVLRPAWMTSISSSLCLLWYSFWCCFVSVMSISGDWL
jgi:hypothetical protein